MSSADRVAHIDGQLMQMCEQYTRIPAEYKCLNLTNQTIHLRMFAGFLFLSLFSAPPQILAASTVFLLPNSRNEEMMGDGSFGATAAGLF